MRQASPLPVEIATNYLWEKLPNSSFMLNLAFPISDNRGPMYSIIETGGFQYKAELGKVLSIPSLADAEVGSELELKSVLLFANGKEAKVGTPVLADALVKVEILRHDRSDKVLVFKKKRRKRYERKKGHRQGFTEVLVTELRSGSESSVVDKAVITRARARIVALLKEKEVPAVLTRKEKIVQGIPKPAKQRKNSLRKQGD